MKEEATYLDVFEVITGIKEYDYDTPMIVDGKYVDCRFYHYWRYGDHNIRDDEFFSRVLKAGNRAGFSVLISSRRRMAQELSDFHVLTAVGETNGWVIPGNDFIVLEGYCCGCCGGNSMGSERVTLKELLLEYSYVDEVKELIRYWNDEDDVIKIVRGTELEQYLERY